MKLILLLTLALAAFSLTACKEKTKTVVVAGDSWAFFVCSYKSLDTALQKVGIQDAGANDTCAGTSRVGLRAEEWMGSTFDKATRLALKDKKVKALYLSLGGNDIMNYWNKDMTGSQEHAVFNRIVADVQAIVNEYQKLRPDIKILISGYDYPRFVPNHPASAYKQAFEEMGSPTPDVLNAGLLRFSGDIAKVADQKSVFYIQHYGLMHYYYGNEEAEMPALRTLAPELISPPNDPTQVGGDLRHLTDPKGMLNVGGVVDAFHLSKSGYEKLADHTVYHYLKSWLQ